MAHKKISSFDAFLECKDLSITELLNYLLNSSSVLRYEAARRLQFFQYNEIKNIITDILLTSHYSRHREIAAFILGQIQESLNKSELNEIISILINLIKNDKSVNVKSSAIFSLGHIFQQYNLGEEEFFILEKNVNKIWGVNRYSIIISLTFSSAFFPKRNYIKKYLIKNLSSNYPRIISWTLYSLKEKQYKSKSIENLLIKRLNNFPENSYIYSEIIAFLISINSRKVKPFVEKILEKDKIDNEIYSELNSNSSRYFKKVKGIMLKKFS